MEMTNYKTVPRDIVTARAAYRDAVRWGKCNECGTTGDGVLHADANGTEACLRCHAQVMLTAAPRLVASLGAVVARVVGTKSLGTAYRVAGNCRPDGFTAGFYGFARAIRDGRLYRLAFTEPTDNTASVRFGWEVTEKARLGRGRRRPRKRREGWR